MTTITDKKQYPGEQYLNELITNIEFAARAPVEVVRAMAAELQKRREADGAEPVAWVMADDLRDNAIVSTPAYPCLDDAKERTIGSLIALYAAPPVPVVPAALPENDDEDGHDIDYLEPSEVYSLGRTAGWNACRAAMLQSQGNCIKNGWISCSERMPDTKTAVLVAKEFDRKGDWRMKWATYIPGHPDANDGWIIPGASWKPSHWMPLPEPPQEVNRG